jgi:hypothetical protein
MTDVAHTLGWLSEDDLRRERASMIRDLLSRPVVDVPAADAICALNQDGGFDGELTDFDRLPAAGEPGHGAALACLGSAQARARMLAALASPDDREFAMAKLHFHHRPLDGAEELRTVAAGIAQMTRPDAQVRALHALARQNVSHREGMEKLVRLFVDAESADVRRALADVFVRADMRAIATPELLRVLRERRPQGDERGDIIDILIRRLERFVSVADAQPRM